MIAVSIKLNYEGEKGMKKFDAFAYKKLYDDNLMPVAVYSVIQNEKGEIEDLVFEYANEAMAKRENFTPKTILGKRFSKTLKIPLSENILSLLYDAAFNGKPGVTQDYWPSLGYGVSIQFSAVSYGYIEVRVVPVRSVTDLKSQNEQLITKIPGGIVIIELTDELRFYHCNNWYYDILGYTSEEYISIYENDQNSGIHPEDVHILKDSIERCVNGAEGDSLTFRVMQKNGTYRYLSLNTSVITRNDNKITLYGMYTDVDSFVKLSNKLAYINAEMDNIVASIPGGISKYTLSDDGTLIRLYSSPGMAEIVGKTVEEYEKDFTSDWKENIYHADFPFVQKKMIECIKTCEPTEFTYRLIHKDGSLVWVTALVKVIGEKEGKPLAHAVFHTMTESTQLYQTLLDNTDTITIVRDLNTHEILYANKAAVEFSGIDQNSLIGTKCYQSLMKCHSPCEDCTLFLDSGETKEKIFNGRCYNISMEKITWNGRESCAEFFNDITDLWNIQKSLETERDKLKHTIIKLQENEERLNAVYQRAELFFWEIDINSGNVTSSSFGTNIFKNLNLNDKTFANDFIIPADVEYFTAMTKLAATDKESHNSFDVRVGQSIDKCEWFRISYDILSDNEGTPLTLLGLAQNINELKLEQRRLDEEIQNIDAASQNKDVLATMSINLTDNKVENFTYQPSLNFTVDRDTVTSYTSIIEVLSDTLITKNHQEEFLKVQSVEALSHAFENGENNLSFDFLIDTENFPSVWVNTSIRLYKHPSTKKLMCFTYYYNINDIHTTKEIINRVVENGYLHISIIDTKNRKISLSIDNGDEHLYFNNNDIFDRSLMEFFAKYTEQRHAESNFDCCCLSNVIDELKDRAEFTFQFSTHSTQKKQRILFTFSWFDEEKTKILLLVTDITDIYQQEIKRSEELGKALEAAVFANKSKTDFLSRMSHEIRTPMNAILGMSKLGIDIAESEEVSAYFTDINNSGNYLLGLINDILDMSRIEQGKMEIFNNYENSGELIRSIEVVIRHLAEAKNIDFSIDILGDKVNYIYTDKLRTQQIYINILNNAVKFTESGGKVKWVIDSEILDDESIKISTIITDTGCGMSKEFLNHLYEPFSQEKNISMNARQSTGLGLSIAKGIVEKMNGTISVESELGKGTTFKIDFIRRYKNDVQKPTFSEETDDAKTILNGKKVLLCEDHPLNTTLAVKLLEKIGMSVETAENGLIGVEKFNNSSENEFAAVLMDIKMPVMNGFEATAKIRALNRQDAKSVPIIAMTANAFAEDKELSKKAGMNEHLSKPIEPELLYKTLSDYIK